MHKKLLSIAVFACFAAHSLFAQIGRPDYGDVTLEELEMTKYEKDSSTQALYLIDYGNSKFVPRNLKMQMEIHVRIKVLEQSGLDYGNLEFSYIKGDSDLTKLKAATYNLEDGKIVKTEVSKKEWITEKVNDKLYVKKISMPNVRVGSVIEYTYFQNIGDIYSLPSWNFQSSIPTVHAEFKIGLPQYGSYMPNFQGYVQSVYSNTDKGIYHIVMKDVSALKSVPYVTTMENFRSRLEFEIKSISAPSYGTKTFMKDWPSINAEMLEYNGVGKAFNRRNAARKLIPQDQNWTNNEESLIEIYNHVRDHFTWNEKVAYGVVDTSKELWKEAEGDNADINITLGQFLKQVGIEAYPVLLSTRRHGYVNLYAPLVSQFNYLIVYARIGEKEYLLDATDKNRPYNVLPSRALNGDGFMIREQGARWIGLGLNKEMNSKVFSYEFGINEDDELEGTGSLVFRSSAAADMRDRMAKQEEEYESSDSDEESSPMDSYTIGEIENLEFKDLEDPSKPLMASFDFVLEDGYMEVGDKLFIKPMLKKHASSNPFKLDERDYPVEFAQKTMYTYLFKVTIPEGYEVSELPKSENIKLPEGGGRFIYTIGEEAGTVQLIVRYQLLKTTYKPSEYIFLKQLYDLIVAKQEQQIVFSPISGK